MSALDSVPANGARRSRSAGGKNVIAAANNTSAPIFWLTGLSGAGKTTLATRLVSCLQGEGFRAALLDGDVLRSGLSRGLGFSVADRLESIRRAGEAALLLAQAHVAAVAALISPIRTGRETVAARARECGIPFAEVFVHAELEVCEQRDPKGLYRRARAGEIRHLTGIDSPYEPPATPDLELRTDRESVEASTEKLTQFALALMRRNRHGSGSVPRET